MLSLPGAVRVFVCLQPTDMRRSFDGLMAMTERIIQREPLSGHLFVFRNKRGDRLKILYWDRDGFAIWYKRLEQGTFCLPATVGDSIEVTPDELRLLLDGIDPASVRRQPRYRRDRQEYF